MAKTLRSLLVEDNEDDLHLVVRELTRGGYAPVYRQVYTETALRSALKEERWDVVVCDYALPSFRAEDALKVVQEADPDMPFIVVSGRIGEETAVAMMREGAHDYLMKDNLCRLVPAIERELREAEVRRRRRRAEEELRAANAAKDRFLATLSHELRNPLAAISASLDALWLRVGGDPAAERGLTIMKRNVEIQARFDHHEAQRGDPSPACQRPTGPLPHLPGQSDHRAVPYAAGRRAEVGGLRVPGRGATGRPYLNGPPAAAGMDRR